jgi:hypothetical protein
MLRKLVLVGLVGVTSLIANIAAADEAVAPTTAMIGASNVSFNDSANGGSAPFALNFNTSARDRFAGLSAAQLTTSNDSSPNHYEVSLVAHGAANVDVALAHRSGFGVNREGDISRESRGSEIRVGRGLLPMQRNGTPQQSRWYLFAGSEDQAIIWQPGARSEFGGAGQTLALQDRVEIGDRQAGITYETHGVQASLAYVERKVRVHVFGRRLSEDENFTGITLTMRH